MKRFSLFVILVTVSFCLHAQTEKELASWYTYNITGHLNKKWGVWTELQLRSLRLTDQYYYYEIKVGAQYKISESASVLGGIGRYNTYSAGENFKTPLAIKEIRTWLQLNLKNNMGRLRIEHRYRVEQRWINDQYRNRIRYRLSLVLPLNKPNLEDNTLFLSVFDELFVSDNKPHFERTRLFGGAGFVFNHNYTLQLGACYQYDYWIDKPAVSRIFAQATLLMQIHDLWPWGEVHPAP